jgi:HSP20 family protein
MPDMSSRLLGTFAFAMSPQGSQEVKMAKEEAVAKEKPESRELAHRRPVRQLVRFRDEMDRLFDEFMGAGWPSLRRWADLFGAWPDADATPVLDVYEHKDAVVVKAELPGMEKDDVHVDISGDVLIVRGEKKKDEKVEERDYYCRERAFGAFSRSIRLPVEVQGDKASATFKNGVLELRLPKTEAAKRRSVSIKVE